VALQLELDDGKPMEGNSDGCWVQHEEDAGGFIWRRSTAMTVCKLATSGVGRSKHASEASNRESA